MAMYLGSQKVCPVVKVGDTINNKVLYMAGNFVHMQASPLHLCKGNVNKYDSTIEIQPIMNNYEMFSNTYDGSGGSYVWELEPNEDYTLFVHQYGSYYSVKTVNISSNTAEAVGGYSEVGGSN